MLTLIESLSTYSDGQVSLGSREFPSLCVVEDRSGERIVVSSDGVIPAPLWDRAVEMGSRMVAIPDPSGVRAITVADFEARRVHTMLGWRVAGAWPLYPSLPSYYDIVSAPVEVAPSRFVHLHCHSEFSPLDGLSRVPDMVDRVVSLGQHALAVTDHGVCAAHPRLQIEADRAGIKPIFGIEANFVNDRFSQTSDDRSAYTHLIMWAQNDDGLRNLWAMSTEANRTGFFYRPRMDWDVLSRYSEGVMASTACLRGPLADAILNDRPAEVDATLARLLGIFGDRLYVEIQTNRVPDQRALNEALVELAHTNGLPLILASDAHYVSPDDRDAHGVWLSVQTSKPLDESGMFEGDSDYHIMSEDEVRASVDYLPASVVDEAIANTGRIADLSTARVQGDTKAPVYSRAQSHEDAARRDAERLMEVCRANWSRCQGRAHSEEEYEARLQREMSLLIDKGFCGYFLLVSDYCSWARRNGILVGPGRGSGGGSLIAYLCDITSIDPVENDLIFERFLTEGRVELPDFDVDFPRSKRSDLNAYLAERWGLDNIIRVGTHIHLKNRGVIRDMARVLKGRVEMAYTDIAKVSKIIEDAESDKAGLGMSWDDLWDEAGDLLEPWREMYPEIFDMAGRVVGRLKSYGKHPAGMVISPDGPLVDRLPLRRGADDDDEAETEMVAEFDLDSLEAIGLVKFDLLTLRTLDTIQDCIDMIREQRGDVIDVYSWDAEYRDPQVWDEVSEGHTLGIFQIETPGGTRATRRMKPRSVADLADVITLVRPGPVRSGLTETYFRRRDGEEEVSYPDPRLEPILSSTYGCIIYQEQVMQVCMTLAGYDSNEADAVRKILGKKQTERVAAEGEKFRERAAERGTDPQVAERLWEQMAEFSKYAFGKAHAYGYAVLGVWTAWLKFHYPVQFLTAALSTVDKGRIPDFVSEARRMGYRVLPPDINLSGRGFSAGALEVRYGLDGVKGVGASAVAALIENQPYESWDDFMARKTGKVNMGVVKLLARAGAFESIVPNRLGLERRLEWETSPESTRCVFRDDDAVGAPNDLPCVFDWSSEEAPVNAKGQRLKLKPPPKRCTKACRNYTPPPTPDFDTELELTPEQIMERERELFGINLTYTPFDRVPDELWDPEVATSMLGAPIVRGLAVEDGPSGSYLVVAELVKAPRPYVASNGREMGFCAFFAVDFELDVVVFSDEWERYRRDLRKGGLYILGLRKNDRGISLSHLTAI